MFTQTVNENQNTYTIHQTRNSIDTPSRIERNQRKNLHRKSTPRSGNAYYTVNIKHVPRSSCLQLVIFSEDLLTEIIITEGHHLEIIMMVLNFLIMITFKEDPQVEIIIML